MIALLFYPTSGGQVHDLGKLTADGQQIDITEVADEEDGRILHFAAGPLPAGTQVHGSIDSARRFDHVQQHSGQHVLSLRSFSSSICPPSASTWARKAAQSIWKRLAYLPRKRRKRSCWPMK